MIFHENRLLADDSHVVSYLIFVMSQTLSSAAVVIDALRVNSLPASNTFRCLLITFVKTLFPDQTR